MRQIMVRYTVHPDRVEENARQIEQVFADLREAAPGGISYASYRLDDGVSFVHIASVRDPEHNPLRSLDTFRAFTESVRERCAIAPVTSVLQEIGSYVAAVDA